MKELFDIQQISQSDFNILLFVVLTAGVVLGWLLAYALMKSRYTPKEAASVKMQEEFVEFKNQVNQHFNKSSAMFKDITTQYKNLYDHMSIGAVDLCDADTMAMPKLEVQDSDGDSGVKEERLAAKSVIPAAGSDLETEIKMENEVADETNASKLDKSIAKKTIDADANIDQASMADQKAAPKIS